MATAPQSMHQRGSRAWLAILFGTRPSAHSRDLALLVVRAALGWIFIWYGAGKLFGWFSSPDRHQTELLFADTAHIRPAAFFAVVSGVIELGGGIAVALGLGARLAGLALFGEMVLATITVTRTHGPTSYNLNLALGALTLVVALLGPGRLSVDARLERRLQATGERPPS